MLVCVASGKRPVFLLANGRACPLMTKLDSPYLYHGNPQIRPTEATKTRCFACRCDEVALPLRGECERRLPGKQRAPQADTPVAPAPDKGEEPEPAREEEAVADVDVEAIMKEKEAAAKLPGGACMSLRAEAARLFYHWRRKPKEPVLGNAQTRKVEVGSHVCVFPATRHTLGPTRRKEPHRRNGRDYTGSRWQCGCSCRRRRLFRIAGCLARSR